MSIFKANDKVKWNSSGGESEGVIVKQITKPTTVKGFAADPNSSSEKEYLVRTSQGKEAIHKASALKKV